MKVRKSIALLGTMLVAGVAVAAPTKFTIGVGGNKATQVFSVDSEADFENFTGRTQDITGTVTFDPAKKTGSGSVTIDVSTIDTGIALRNEHMRSPGWLDTAKYPQATFVTTSVKNLSGDNYTVTGKLTVHGVTKTVTTTAMVRFLKASASTKAARFAGDVLQIKTSFKVRLADYGIKVPPMVKGKVAETVTIKLSAFAQSG